MSLTQLVYDRDQWRDLVVFDLHKEWEIYLIAERLSACKILYSTELVYLVFGQRSV